MVEKTPYTFTVNPDDKHQYVRRPCRIAMVTADVRELLYTTLGSDYEYELYTEVSKPEQSQEGKITRIHYHGIIRLTPFQCAEFYVDKMPYLNMWCRIEVDTIKDINKWEEYICKDRHEMEPYCNYYKVPYMLSNKMLYKPRKTSGAKSEAKNNINMYFSSAPQERERGPGEILLSPSDL